MDRPRIRDAQSTGNFVSLAVLVKTEMTPGQIIRDQGEKEGSVQGELGKGEAKRSRIRSKKAECSSQTGG